MTDKFIAAQPKHPKKSKQTIFAEALKTTASYVGINEGIEMLTGVPLSELYASNMAPLLQEYTGTETTLGTVFAVYMGVRAIKRLTDMAIEYFAKDRSPGPRANDLLNPHLRDFVNKTNLTVAKYDPKQGRDGCYWVKRPGEQEWELYTYAEFRGLQIIEQDRPFHIIEIGENGKEVRIKTEYHGAAINETVLQAEKGVFETRVSLKGEPIDIVDTALEESRLAIMTFLPSLSLEQGKDDEEPAPGMQMEPH